MFFKDHDFDQINSQNTSQRLLPACTRNHVQYSIQNKTETQDLINDHV